MKSINEYVKRMESALKEKLFFLDIINPNDYDYIVDFGCANGTLLNYLKAQNISTTLIGYDNNLQMIEMAKKEAFSNDIIFTNDYNYIQQLSGKKCIILSSVLHENEINNFLFEDTVSLLNKFDTIIIRDMFWNENLTKNVNELSLQIVKEKVNSKVYEDFVNIYGEIKTNKQLSHLLLKYDYLTNWETEKKENYFLFDFRKLIQTLLNYDAMFYSHEVLKFKKDKIQKDFGLNFNYPTHLKLILKRK